MNWLAYPVDWGKAKKFQAHYFNIRNYKNASKTNHLNN